MSDWQNQVDALTIALQLHLPTIIWGEPGVGKTSVIEAIAKTMDLRLEKFIGSQYDPSDAGFPMPVLYEPGAELRNRRGDVVSPHIPGEKVIKRITFDWVYELNALGEGVIFLDEFSLASYAMQAVMMQLLLENTISGIKLPDGVIRVCAANPSESAAGGRDLSAPAANRLLHLDWKVDIKEWRDAYIEDFPPPKILTLPDTWTTFLPQAKSLIYSYSLHRADDIQKLPDNHVDAGKAWPSLRTWADYATPVLAAGLSLKYTSSHPVLHLLIEGCVGSYGSTFLDWVKKLDLPDPRMLLKNPQSLPNLNTNDKMNSALMSVVGLALSEPTQDNVMAAWEVIMMAVQHGKKAIASLSARVLLTRWPPEFPKPKGISTFHNIVVGD